MLSTAPVTIKQKLHHKCSKQVDPPQNCFGGAIFSFWWQERSRTIWSVNLDRWDIDMRYGQGSGFAAGKSTFCIYFQIKDVVECRALPECNSNRCGKNQASNDEILNCIKSSKSSYRLQSDLIQQTLLFYLKSLKHIDVLRKRYDEFRPLNQSSAKL